MDFFYPIFMAFGLVFMSELGDKTQLLVLSFSSKLKSFTILFGVALGSFFSHGIAILFGSALGSLNNEFVHSILKFITYISFLFFGIITLMNNDNEDSEDKKNGVIKKISNLKIGYILIIALSICIGELGDKTFLASLGLGIQYPYFKVYLIIGAILGMVISDSIAILFGKFLSHKISSTSLNILSGIIFIAFGIFGFIDFFINLL